VGGLVRGSFVGCEEIERRVVIELFSLWSYGVGCERSGRIEAEVGSAFGHGEDASHYGGWQGASDESRVCVPDQHWSQG